MEGSGRDRSSEHASSSGRRSTVSNAKFEVEKFDETSNFDMWQCEVMDVLIQQELEIALEGKPDDMTDQGWKKLNTQVCSTIRLCLTKEQKYFVMRETNAKVLWQKLEDKFMKKSIESRLHLKKKLFRFQFREGISMSEHLNSYNQILADLLNLDVEIEDEDKTLLLLNSLPDTYEHLITTLLYEKETRWRPQSRYPRKKNGFHSKTRATSRGSSVGRKLARDECSFCHNKGHWRKDCPNRKGQQQNQPSTANVVDRDDDSDFSLISSSSICHSDEWIMDSGCTYHMCPNRDWFTDFTKIEGGAVLMGNDSACKTQGIGSIRLKLHNGSIKTLTKVRYVPDLRKNLISLGFLDSKGFRIAIEDGTLKVLMGVQVAMKGLRRGNLYFLGVQPGFGPGIRVYPGRNPDSISGPGSGPVIPGL
ncbi:hypothetical protein I3760_08G075400 [Carya illinoinensis]|nr:hypothetical protein I3760_08G075400 [Carya illinoinensis]